MFVHTKTKKKRKWQRKVFLLLLLFLLPIVSVLSFIVLFIGGGTAESHDVEATTGGVKLSAKQFADKTKLGISEEEAKNALAFADRLMSRHHFTAQATAGVLAVGFRESGFDVKAVNNSGGVAGFFQWSGWGSSVNGDRWKVASKRELTLEVEVDLMSTELDGRYADVVKKVGSATDEKQAAKDWSQYYEGVAVSDGQTKADKIESWATTICEALKSGGTNYAKVNNTGTSSTAIPQGWENISAFDGHAYEGSENYPQGQCTWYVYNRAKQLGVSFSPYMGNGGQWYQVQGYHSSHTPKAHTALSFVNGQAGSDPTYGHVAFVEAVKDDGSILISEMNVYGQPAMTAAYRTFDAETAKQFWHVEGK